MTELELKAFNVEISNGALKGKELPKRLKILNWGKSKTTNGDVTLNEQTMAVFEGVQKEAGREEDVALDFDHCTVPGSKEYVEGAPKHIAAYGNPELIKGDGLYLTDLEWTPEGEKFARNYKDLSPAVAVTKDGIVTGLHSAALTPTGAVYGLKFFSAQGFEDMIKKLAVTDAGKNSSSNPLALDADDYNKDGANAGVKKVGNSYEIAVKDASDMGTMSADDMEEHDPENPDCECADCMSANNKTFSTNAKVGTSGDKQTKTKAMSANNPSFPDAYKAQMPQYNTMNDSIIKMAAEVGMDGETDVQKVLFAFLAKYEGLKAEITGQINTKENTSEGGLKQFSAKIDELNAKIVALENQKSEEAKRHNDVERDNLVKQASRDGKIIPFSADTLKTVDVAILREVVANAPKSVPMNSTMKVLSADSIEKPSRDKAIKAFNAQLKMAA